jgi:hypothetical protein
MPKTMMINKIEHEIEVLTPKEQVKLFNWFGKLINNSRRVVVNDKSEITTRLNRIYSEVPQEPDRGVLSAQLATLEREIW